MNTPKTPDISINYLGLELNSPIIPSASPLSEKISSIQEMEVHGAGAVVLATLFEEPDRPRLNHPDYYYEHITAAKKVVKMPIIASLNATTSEGWKGMAQRMEQAGADAIELNIYHMSLNRNTPSADIERAYIDIAGLVSSGVTIPVAVKLPPFFTNLAYMAKEIHDSGARGVVLFNRFYQADLDLTNMGPQYSLRLSTPEDHRLPLRWISLLYQQEVGYLCASTGIHTGGDVLKMLLCGASATQVCSVLLKRGIPWIKELESELKTWMEKCKISSLRQERGSKSHRWTSNVSQIEREEYRKALQGYTKLEVPTWHDDVTVLSSQS